MPAPRLPLPREVYEKVKDQAWALYETLKMQDVSKALRQQFGIPIHHERLSLSMRHDQPWRYKALKQRKRATARSRKTPATPGKPWDLLTEKARQSRRDEREKHLAQMTKEGRLGRGKAEMDKTELAQLQAKLERWCTPEAEARRRWEWHLDEVKALRHAGEG